MDVMDKAGELQENDWQALHEIIASGHTTGLVHDARMCPRPGRAQGVRHMRAGLDHWRHRPGYPCAAVRSPVMVEAPAAETLVRTADGGLLGRIEQDPQLPSRAADPRLAASSQLRAASGSSRPRRCHAHVQPNGSRSAAVLQCCRGCQCAARRGPDAGEDDGCARTPRGTPGAPSPSPATASGCPLTTGGGLASRQRARPESGGGSGAGDDVLHTDTMSTLSPLALWPRPRRCPPSVPQAG